jgi:hypothetical protein
LKEKMMARMSKYMEALKNIQGAKPGLTADQVLGMQNLQSAANTAPAAGQQQQGSQQFTTPLPFEAKPSTQIKIGGEGQPGVENFTQVSSASTSNLRKFKILDDFGDEIEEEVDIGKDESLQELVAGRHKSKHLEAELETIRGELSAKELYAKKLMDKYGKFEGMTSEQIADALLNERGGLNGLVEAKLREQEEFRKLSKEEQTDLVRRQEEKKRNDEITSREDKLNQRLKDIEAAEGRAKAETITNLVRASASKYCPNKVENKELLKINAMIFNEAKAEIAALEKSGVMLTHTIVEQKFKKAFLNNKGLVDSVKSRHSIKGNGIVEATKEALAAGGAENQTATKTSSADSVNESALLDKWFQLTVNGRGSEVEKEVNSNPALYKPIHRKLSQRFRHKR